MKYEFPEYPDNWNEIIKLVKARDKYTCRICNTKFKPNSKWLRVHHKIPISKWIRLKLKGSPHNPSNLITCCNNCHKDEHPHLRSGYKKIKFKRKTKFGYSASKRRSSFSYSVKRR